MEHLLGRELSWLSLPRIIFACVVNSSFPLLSRLAVSKRPSCARVFSCGWKCEVHWQAALCAAHVRCVRKKGIALGQAEKTNLRARARGSPVTCAETIRTCSTDAFYGGEYVSAVELLNDKHGRQGRATFAEADGRYRGRTKVTIRDVVALYGQRSRHPEV